MFQDRAKKWWLPVFVAVVAGCLAVGSASGQATSGQLRAFQRPARATDAVPRTFLPIFRGRYGTVVASRQIATGTGFRGRAAVYLIRLKRHYTCLLRTIRSGGAGGAGCSPSGEFLSAKMPIQASTGGRFLSGAVCECDRAGGLRRSSRTPASGAPDGRRRLPLFLPWSEWLPRPRQCDQRLQRSRQPRLPRTPVVTRSGVISEHWPSRGYARLAGQRRRRLASCRRSAFAETWPVAWAVKVNLPGAVSTNTAALLGGVMR